MPAMPGFEFPPDLTRCRDCGAARQGPFCSACGAPAARRLDGREICRELGERLLELDFPLLRTLWSLLARPGQTLRDYLQGRRQQVAPPARFFFVWVTVCIALTLLFDLPHSPRISTEGLPADASAALQAMPEFVFAVRAYITFFALIPLAWLGHRLYRADDLRVAEMMAILLYAGGLGALLQIPISALLQASPPIGFAAGRLLVWSSLLFVLLRGLLGGQAWRHLWRAGVLGLLLLPLLSVLGGSAFILSALLGLTHY